MVRIVIALAVLACSGCAAVYSTGQRPDGSSWRTAYVSLIWDKDFRGIDLARGRAEALSSKPDADATKALAAGIVEGIK